MGRTVSAIQNQARGLVVSSRRRYARKLGRLQLEGARCAAPAGFSGVVWGELL